MDNEIRWTNGKEDYTREEVSYMLQTQRAMIKNDSKYLLLDQARRKGLKGQLTKDGREWMDSLNNRREVEF